MPLEIVKLETRSGGLVTTVEIPEFDPPAEIIVWGQRYFIRSEKAGTYMEAMVAWAPVRRSIHDG